MSTLAHFLRRDWRIAVTHRTPFAFDAVAALASAALFYYLSRYVGSHPGGQTLFAFAVAGLVVVRVQGSLPYITRTLETEIERGNLELLLSSPLRTPSVVVGETAFEMLRAGFFALMLLVLATTLFGAPFQLTAAGVAGTAVGIAGAMALFLSIALLVLGVIMFVRQGGALVTLTALVAPIVAGAYFPVESLPEPLRSLSAALPFHLPVDLIRDAMQHGTFAVAAAWQLAVEGALLFALALAVLHAGVEHCRRNGTLGRP